METTKSELANDLYSRLKQPRKALKVAAIGRWRDQAFSEGWLAAVDVEDLLADFDDRLWRVDNRAVAALFRVPVTTLFHRPRSRSSSVSGQGAYLLPDLISLLAGFERLGFDVDPAPWAEGHRLSLASKDRLTGTELTVWWYPQCRHKAEPVEIWPDDPPHRIWSLREERLVTPAGYRATARLDAEGKAHALSVAAPKHRRRKDPVETVCADCGHTWWRGDPESSRMHRRVHKKEMAIRAPAPDARLLAALDGKARPEEVLPDSPQWKHDLVYERAVRFRREFGYDFVQWSRTKRDDKAVAYVFADDTGAFGRGAPVGACAFRLRGHVWTLDWVWVIPTARRKGVLRRRWPAFREKFGKFALEYPTSDAMEAFAARHAPWLTAEAPTAEG